MADVGPADAAATAISSSDTFTSPAVIGLGAAAARAAGELLTQAWPANARSSVYALAFDAEAVDSDIENHDLASLESEVGTIKAQAQVAAADLGL